MGGRLGSQWQGAGVAACSPECICARLPPAKPCGPAAPRQAPQPRLPTSPLACRRAQAAHGGGAVRRREGALRQGEVLVRAFVLFIALGALCCAGSGAAPVAAELAGSTAAHVPPAPRPSAPARADSRYLPAPPALQVHEQGGGGAGGAAGQGPRGEGAHLLRCGMLLRRGRMPHGRLFEGKIKNCSLPLPRAAEFPNTLHAIKKLLKPAGLTHRALIGATSAGAGLPGRKACLHPSSSALARVPLRPAVPPHAVSVTLAHRSAAPPALPPTCFCRSGPRQGDPGVPDRPGEAAARGAQHEEHRWCRQRSCCASPACQVAALLPSSFGMRPSPGP